MVYQCMREHRTLVELAKLGLQSALFVESADIGIAELRYSCTWPVPFRETLCPRNNIEIEFQYLFTCLLLGQDCRADCSTSIYECFCSNVRNLPTFNSATVSFFRLSLEHETNNQLTASIVRVQIPVSAMCRFFVLCSLGRDSNGLPVLRLKIPKIGTETPP